MATIDVIEQSTSADLADTASVRKSNTRTDLDGLVVNLELTLISIIQGVALYFLTESSRGLLMSLQFAAWPYIAAGLLIILLWWSRAVIHTLTVIRWPIEFGHNFLYITSTLVEATMFTQVGNPGNWFLIGAAYVVLLWLLFVVDLRLIARRLADQCGPASQALLHVIYREQRFHATFSMPATVLFYLVAGLAIHTWSGFFIEQNGHLIFGVLQLIGAVAYVTYIVFFFRRISGMVLAARQEAQ
jgi:hypothetical protein